MPPAPRYHEKASTICVEQSGDMARLNFRKAHLLQYYKYIYGTTKKKRKRNLPTTHFLHPFPHHLMPQQPPWPHITQHQSEC
jgi:hypothetical protein